jgi:hypothetical protein
LAYMTSFSKKDDLCDSFLQGVAYLESGGVTSKGYKRKTKKVEKTVDFTLHLANNVTHTKQYANYNS